jgi:hypothetical protein
LRCTSQTRPAASIAAAIIHARTVPSRRDHSLLIDSPRRQYSPARDEEDSLLHFSLGFDRGFDRGFGLGFEPGFEPGFDPGSAEPAKAARPRI